jgi:hypothetical protein
MAWLAIVKNPYGQRLLFRLHVKNMPTSLITQRQRMFKASPLTLQTATLDFSSCKPLFRLVEIK